MTITDLVFLVLGVALALSMTWQNRWDEPTWGYFPLWEWQVKARFLLEAIEKTCLAMIPLVGWRRYRLGGPCRPAELLLVAFGLPRIVHDLDWAIGSTYGTFASGAFLKFEPLYWGPHAAALATSLAALLGLYLGRDRLGDRSRSALWLVVVGASYPWLLSPLRGLELAATIHIDGVGGWPWVAVAVVFETIKSLVPAILGCVALLDLIRRRARLAAIEWIGLTLATLDVAVGLTVAFPRRFTIWTPANQTLTPIQTYTALFEGPIAATILGALLVALLGNTWFRTFGPSRDPNAAG